MAMHYNWSDFSSEDKHEIRSLHATFVLAPREMSSKRLVEFVKEHLPKGNIVFGIAQESFVDGFEQQAQFRMLDLAALQPLVDKIASSNVKHKIFPFTYPQSVVDEVVRMIKPTRAVVVRGSYHRTFHRRSTYYVLKELGVPFEYASPFASEIEAKSYLEKYMQEHVNKDLTFIDMGEDSVMEMVGVVAKQSFDYSFQTGCVLARKSGTNYTSLLSGYNAVIPYQTYALHFGNSREDNLSEVQDANHYDTIHAEMYMLVAAGKQNISLRGASLFINTLPCPNCARTLSQTGIAEVVYENDHSDGYAAKLFGLCGITTRRLTS